MSLTLCRLTIIPLYSCRPYIFVYGFHPTEYRKKLRPCRFTDKHGDSLFFEVHGEKRDRAINAVLNVGFSHPTLVHETVEFGFHANSPVQYPDDHTFVYA